MSSLALMRWLEGSPERYDAGMRVITLGAVGKLHDAVAAAAVVSRGDRVLEIGCGTGAVTSLMLARGARVTAIDQSPEMLEQAKQRPGLGADSDVTWLEQTASEIDGLPAASYDAVASSLCLTDMSRSERTYVLREIARVLVPGGRLVIGDEVRANGGWRRALQRCWRVPQAILGWLLAGHLSRPIGDLSGEIRAAGFEITGERRWMMGALALVIAESAR